MYNIDAAVKSVLKLLCTICCGTQKAEKKDGKQRLIWAPNAEESYRGLVYESKVRNIKMLI